MKKLIAIPCTLFLCFVFTACSENKETVDSIVQKWCELNTKVQKAESGSAEHEKAKEARKKLEDEIETKYKDNKAFYDKIVEESRKCDQ